MKNRLELQGANMTTRFPVLFVVLIVCVLAACSDQRPRPDTLPVDHIQQTERLLENAESASPEDKYNLGMRYERGTAVPQNYREAARWYRLSAMHAYPDAQYKLCEMSEHGRGVPQDYQEALRWCGLAADSDAHWLAAAVSWSHFHRRRQCLFDGMVRSRPEVPGDGAIRVGYAGTHAGNLI
jgi:hypothetical protein